MENLIEIGARFHLWYMRQILLTHGLKLICESQTSFDKCQSLFYRNGDTFPFFIPPYNLSLF